MLLWAGWLLGLLVAIVSLFLPTWEAQRFVLFYVAPLVPAVVLWARERLAYGAEYSPCLIHPK